MSPQVTPNAQRMRRVLGACEAEASEIRYEAEEAARIRQRAAETDARRRLEEARRSSQELVIGPVVRLSRMRAEIERRQRGIVSRLEGARAVSEELRLLVDVLDRTAAGLTADAPVDRVE